VHALIFASNRNELARRREAVGRDAEYATAKSSQSAAIGLRIVGGVITVAGASMFLVGARKDAEPAKTGVRFVPAFGPGFAGVGLSDRF
jgi:hypothetical protein